MVIIQYHCSAGRKIQSDCGPEEMVYYRTVTRADFPLEWDPYMRFEDENEYNRYIEKYIGKTR